LYFLLDYGYSKKLTKLQLIIFNYFRELFINLKHPKTMGTRMREYDEGLFNGIKFIPDSSAPARE